MSDNQVIFQHCECVCILRLLRKLDPWLTIYVDSVLLVRIWGIMWMRCLVF